MPRSVRSRDGFRCRRDVLLGPDVFFEPLRRLVPAIVYHITLIHMVIARGAVTTRLRRKLSEQCEGQCEEGGVAWREEGGRERAASGAEVGSARGGERTVARRGDGTTPG